MLLGNITFSYIKLGSEKFKYKNKRSTAVINITLRHVGLSIFALENKQVLYILSMCF